MPAPIQILLALPQRWVLRKNRDVRLDLKPRGLTIVEHTPASPNGNPRLHTVSSRYLVEFAGMESLLLLRDVLNLEEVRSIVEMSGRDQCICRGSQSIT